MNWTALGLGAFLGVSNMGLMGADLPGMSEKNILSVNDENVPIKVQKLIDETSSIDNEDDEEMYEVGQDYAFMVKVPFQFIVKQDELLAAV